MLAAHGPEHVAADLPQIDRELADRPGVERHDGPQAST
jgi:hypothetical protein